MRMGATVLYLGMLPDDPNQILKLAGIRRYAALRGWEVVRVTRDELRPDGVPSLLARCRPVGAVVEGSSRIVDCPPRLFGSVPLAYIEYPAAETEGKAPNVVIDNDAVADAAFRELSHGRPSAFAAVGHIVPHLWSRLRVAAFKKCCAANGSRCIVFPGKTAEESDAYEHRLARWIASLPRRTAVFAVSNAAATVVTRAARAVHRHIPKEMTLIAFGDVPGFCDVASPPVTTIPLDFERMGFVAARALGEVLASRSGRWPSFSVECNRTDCRRVKSNAIGKSAIPIGPLLVTRRKSTAGRGRREPWVLKAVEMIRAEACDGLTIASLVERLRTEKGRPVSRRNFDRRFCEAMGHTANEEIISVRLESVCALLAQTDTPVTIVHDFCGFENYHALNAQFRSRFKMPMTRWREKNAR